MGFYVTDEKGLPVEIPPLSEHRRQELMLTHIIHLLGGDEFRIVFNTHSREWLVETDSGGVTRKTRASRSAEKIAEQWENGERTSRGFRIFGSGTDRDGDEWTVSESSLAGEGPHCRLYLTTDGMQLTPEMASELILALKRFCDEAALGLLTEKPSPFT